LSSGGASAVTRVLLFLTLLQFGWVLAVTRSSACDTSGRRHLVAVRGFAGSAFPSAPALGSTGSGRPFYHFSGLVLGSPSYFGEVRLLGLVHHRLRLSPSRMRAVVLSGQTQDLPVPYEEACAHAGSQTTPNRADARVVASARIAFHAKTVSAFESRIIFRGSMAGLCVPLSRFAAALTDDCA